MTTLDIRDRGETLSVSTWNQGRQCNRSMADAGMPAKNVACKRTTVVYIEPDRANALLMRYLLEARTDFTLHHAANGNSGLQLCRQLKPDVVITGMRLPDMTGYDILKGLRANAGISAPACIALSGDAMPANIKQALDSGFEDYLTKPIDIWWLLQKIERTVMRQPLDLLPTR